MRILIINLLFYYWINKIRNEFKSIKIWYTAFCLRVNRVFLISVNGKWRYYRDCAYLGEPGIGGDERYCLMRTGTHNIFIEMCTCVSKDGCNTASTLEKYTLLIFSGSLLLAYSLMWTFNNISQMKHFFSSHFPSETPSIFSRIFINNCDIFLFSMMKFY